MVIFIQCANTTVLPRIFKVPLSHYSAIKKNEIMPFAATWMNLEIVIFSEVSHTEKEKYHMISHMQNLKRNDTNELICKTETDLQT